MSAEGRSGRRWRWALGAGVYLLVLAVYWPALGGGMIWDDDAHVTGVALRSVHGLWRIWFELGATQQYYPVLHSAFWLEHRIWGDWAAGYHLLNVLLHATAACLLGRALIVLLEGRAGRAWVGWCAACLFAAHPVCVESVAWISEQKNTLSAVFYFLAALAYLKWYRGGGRKRYCLATVLFVLAVLSKTVTATLPAALLVVLWWRKGRLGWRREVAPLVPWFGLGAVGGLLTAWVERQYIGAQGEDFALSVGQRLVLAGRVVWFYLGKVIWPRELMFIYPRWRLDAGEWRQWVPLTGALALTAVLAWAARRGKSRACLCGWLFFGGTLFPALGFFNVYPFLFSYVADHFQYLASAGVISVAAAGLGWWRRRAARAAGATAAALIAVLAALSWRQASLYGSAERLYRATLRQNPGAWLMDGCLGVVLADTGRVSEAIASYQRALSLKPDHAQAHFDLGYAWLQLGRTQDAVAEFNTALRFDPKLAQARVNLGNILLREGEAAPALAQYQEARRDSPHDPAVLVSFGLGLEAAGRTPEAVTAFRAALRLDPDYASAHFDLGNALAVGRTMPEAAQEFAAAVRLRPDFPEAWNNLGAALLQQGRVEEAIEKYEQALRLRPDYAEAEYGLGYAFKAAGRNDEAAAHFRRSALLRAQAGRQPAP